MSLSLVLHNIKAVEYQDGGASAQSGSASLMDLFSLTNQHLSRGTAHDVMQSTEQKRGCTNSNRFAPRAQTGRLSVRMNGDWNVP